MPLIDRMHITMTVMALSSAAICSLPCAVSSQSYLQAVRGTRAQGWSWQSRSQVMSRNGMVAASQPLAAQAGLQILQQGGNAIDAAVATAAALSVTEPMNTGLGGDAFAMIYIAHERKVYALDASGKAPGGATISLLNSKGYRWNPKQGSGPGAGMPQSGIHTVTVPGALWGWDAMLKRFGSMRFERVLAPAITLAEQGFPVSERAASEWELPYALNSKSLDPDSIFTWYIKGNPPRAGQRFTNRDLAKTFRLVAQHGSGVLYGGNVGAALIAKSRQLGGTMKMEDLRSYSGKWVDPIKGTYRGRTVFELPPPSQGWATIEMLNILSHCPEKTYRGANLRSLGPTDPRFWHMLVEAKKLSYEDMIEHNGDPDFNPELINLIKNKFANPSYAASLCKRIDAVHGSTGQTESETTSFGDTVVFSTADRWGNMVSFVGSNYGHFGSGITVPGYGFALHNRGALFTLEPGSPNSLAPRKRPFNTLMAGVVVQHLGAASSEVMTFGLMGGDMQAQGHAQIIVNMLDLGANIQSASDMARFHHVQSTNVLYLESPLHDVLGAKLRSMGHNVRSTNGYVGGFQGILSVDGHYVGGSDHRNDGHVAAW